MGEKAKRGKGRKGKGKKLEPGKGGECDGVGGTAMGHPYPPLILVEGYFDAIALHEAGIRTAVASMGTALTRKQVSNTTSEKKKKKRKKEKTKSKKERKGKERGARPAPPRPAPPRPPPRAH